MGKDDGGASLGLSGEEPARHCRGHWSGLPSGEIPRAVGQLSPWATTTDPVLWSLCVQTTEPEHPGDCSAATGCSSLSHVQLFAVPGLQPARLLCAWDSPGKNAGAGSHFLLQGSNLCLLHCKRILYHLSPQGSPEKQEKPPR